MVSAVKNVHHLHFVIVIPLLPIYSHTHTTNKVTVPLPVTESRVSL